MLKARHFGAAPSTMRVLRQTRTYPGRAQSQAGEEIGRWIGVVYVCLVLLTGCRTPKTFPVVDARDPAWTIQQGQAVWRPRANLPELAGELLVATRAEGASYVQFSKAPMVLAEAQTEAVQWAMRFPPRKLSFGGRGRPPGRFGWLQLGAALRGEAVTPPWQFVKRPEGGWRLENPRTGESMEGYLWP